MPLAVLYLVLLLARLRGVITTANLDADVVSGPVIGELFSSAGPHAHIVLGTFGWYGTLLWELWTKWLPAHREVWEIGPYLIALAGGALIAWSVRRVAGVWAAVVAAILLLCPSPDTLHLLLAMTQHAPDWFCLALLGAFLVAVERSGFARSWGLLVVAALVGGVVGVNAASDLLVVIAGLVPFFVAVGAGLWLGLPRSGSDGPWWRDASHRHRLELVGVMALALVLAWVLTAAVMSAWHVAPERGVHTTNLASVGQTGKNFRLWWQSVVTLGNGSYFGRELSFGTALAVVCAVLSLVAVTLIPRCGWRSLRSAAALRDAPDAIVAIEPTAVPGRLAFVVFWCSSALTLSLAFLLSSLPIDIHADRYLVGLVYAVAALVPLAAVGRRRAEDAVVIGVCVFALTGVVSLLGGDYTRNAERHPTTALASGVEQVAAAHHVRYGYAGYWDAAPITWSTHLRVRVYPVSVCDRGAHLCPFDLHVISSWYTPRAGVKSFLLVDPAQPLVTGPTPDLGPPSAVYHVGRLVMYVYPYDLAARMAQT